MKINHMRKKILYNTETFYKAQKSVIKFFNDCTLIISEAKHASFHGKGLKILTPKKNASKITYTTCTSKSRQYIWKLA